VPVTAGTTYTASYFAPHGHYAADQNFFTTPTTNGPLTAPTDSNGAYHYGDDGGFPDNSFKATNYWVDVLFKPVSTALPSTSTSASATASASTSTPAAHASSTTAPAGTGGGSSLPITGANAAFLAIGGAALVAVGAVLFLIRRRRHKITFTA
jgi:LPXTG-motif cell wall-anchored protein